MKFLKIVIPIILLAMTSCKEVPVSPEDQMLECVISITSTKTGVEVGSSLNLGTEIKPKNQNEEGECKGSVTWESSDPSIVSVDTDGVLTGNGEGKVTIKSYLINEDSESSDSIEIEAFQYVIAFSAHEKAGNDIDIFVMTKDGKHTKNLTNSGDTENHTGYPFFIAWSPDGKVSFSDNNRDNVHVFSINTDGSGKTNITPNADLFQYVSWHPNGKEITGVNRAKYEDENRYFEIVKTNLETQELTRLTFEKVQSGKVPNDPSWSPDGSKIAFATHRDGNWEIYVMNSDGSNKINLTQNSSADETHPIWSPDGSKIAYTVDGDIYVMNSDGSNQKLLAYSGTNPQWNSNDTVVFRGKDRKNIIYSINLDGSNKTKIIQSELRIASFSWRISN